MDFFVNKATELQQKLVTKGLYDIRVLALMGVGFIALTVFWNGAKIVQQNFELSQKVVAIEQENQILELENQNKQLRNQYLETDEFAELTARRVFGKAAPGEKVYIVPNEVAFSALNTAEASLEEELEVSKPQYQKNLETWMNIYFGN